MRERITKTFYKNKEILVIDYSGCKEAAMIEIVSAAKTLVLSENKRVLILSILKKNYLTPAFIRHLEKELKEGEPLVEKNAVVGLSAVQIWILKALNLWYKNQMYHFNDVKEAKDFLVS